MASDTAMATAADRRAALLEHVRAYVETNGYAPTHDELATITGTTRQVTQVDVRVLADAGLIVSEGRRRLRLTGYDVRLIPKS